MARAVERARGLRRDATAAERRLWYLLRSRALGRFKFRRQHPVGPFFADFACVEVLLIVEVDGGQHAEDAGDARRTAWLNAHGWRVMRFWNDEVLGNPDGVRGAILGALGPSPSQR